MEEVVLLFHSEDREWYMWYPDDPHGASKSSVVQFLCVMDRAQIIVWENMDPSGMELEVTVLGQPPWPAEVTTEIP